MVAGMILGCGRSDGSGRELSKLAMQGKGIFELHDCSKCHYIGDEDVQGGAPDLASPFLANDSMFVRAHLKSIESSKMPPIELAENEIRALSHFIAELHRAKHPTISEDKADAHCPVCLAPVKIDESRLSANFLGKKYYFECEQCQEAFQKAPEAFVELLEQHQGDTDDMSAR
jgi:YHS domain-containing protein